MRLSRPCYDKSHRCPGGISGGGWKYGKVEHCPGGYVTVRVIDEGYGGHPGKYRWHFGHCDTCDTVTWPVGLCHLVDPTWWRFAVWRFWDRRIMDSWRDWQEGESLRRIWWLRWSSAGRHARRVIDFLNREKWLDVTKKKPRP